MIKVAYENARKERKKTLDHILNVGNNMATENSGRNGFNLQELSADIGEFGNKLPSDVFDTSESSEGYFKDKTISTLQKLQDISEHKEAKMFFGFLIQKFAELAVYKEDEYEKKFCDLILKINSTDLPNKHDIIKKITNIFTRRVILELSDNKDINESKKISYEIAFNKANNYLGNINNISTEISKSAQIEENPQIIARRIKDIIDVLISGFSTEAKHHAYPNIRNKVMMLNPFQLSQKKAPGGAAIGVSISLIKNILNGKDPFFIRLVIANLGRIL